MKHRYFRVGGTEYYKVVDNERTLKYFFRNYAPNGMIVDELTEAQYLTVIVKEN